MWACAVTAETIAKALGGRKTGGGWMARCPAHDDGNRASRSAMQTARCWFAAKTLEIGDDRGEAGSPWHWQRDDRRQVWTKVREFLRDRAAGLTAKDATDAARSARCAIAHGMNDLTKAECLRGLIERAIVANGAVFWPALAVLEQIDIELESLPKKKREALRAKLDKARQAILFDARQIAEGLAAAVERQAAAEAICVGARCDACAGSRRG